GKGVAVGIGGAKLKHAGKGDVRRRVLWDRVRPIAGKRRLIDVLDGDRDGGDVAHQRAVAGFIGEGVYAVEVRRRGVSEAAIRVQRERAVADVANQLCRQRRTVEVDVVDQHSSAQRAGDII